MTRNLPKRPPRSRLLVVDDQPLNVQAMYRLFAHEHQVLMATGGEKALQLCREANPDLVLLDVVMPGMDGYAVLERLRDDPATADIPVIFVTARDTPEEEARGLALGAVDFIEKPINPEVVRQRVGVHLLLRSREAELRRLNDSLEETVAQRTTALHEQALALERNVRELGTKTNVLEKAPFPIVLLDLRASGPEIAHANEALQATLGHRLADALGRHPGFLFEADDDPSVRVALDDAFAGRRTFESELWGRSSDGSRRRLRCLVFPSFGADSSLLNAVIMLTDITEMHEIQAIRERLAGELQESQKLHSMGLLIAGVAHDLNTPIGIAVTASSHLRGSAERLAAGLATAPVSADEVVRLRAIAEKMQRSTDLIGRNLGKAAQLVRGFKQTTVDASCTDWRKADLHMLLDSMLVTLSPVLRGARCEARLECPAGLSLYTEPGSLGQAITNLVVNATLHAFEGRADRRITIRAREDGEAVCIEVADNGNGMTPEATLRAFTPFFTTRRSGGGSGLGLFSCRRVVEQVLGGELGFETRPGQGACFRLRLPRRAPGPKADRTATSPGGDAPLATEGR